MHRGSLPQLGSDVLLTDSGLETDLIFHGGFELPEFAAFVLIDDPKGVAALEAYYRRHLDISTRHDCGVILEAPTWRASRDWGAAIGYGSADLRRINESALDMLSRLRQESQARSGRPVVISGCIGPRAATSPSAERMTESEAEHYHREQMEVLAATDADMAHAMTITYDAEAIGIVRAAVRADLPVAISFTTETDGRLPDGTSLADALAAVEAATDGAPLYYGVNCAHPSHFESALPAGRLGERLRCVRANASRQSHAAIDDSPLLDDGDPLELAADYARLRAWHPSISILGGCCGTDARHVAAIASACLATTGDAGE